jgi:glycerophosphoryl diester phosphodiesterase
MDSIIFFVYASTSTPLTNPCVLTNPKVIKGRSVIYTYTDDFREAVENTFLSYTETNEFSEAISPFRNEYSDTLNTCKLLMGFKTASGFISGTGTINSATENEEVYTSFIPVSGGETINISIDWSESNSQWVALAKYNSNKEFIARTTLENNVTETTFNDSYRVDSGIYYIAFTFRTYGNAKCVITKDWTGLNTNINNIVETSAGSLFEEEMFALNLPSNTIRSIAHRGDGIKAPECTAPAYILARKHGHTIVENDVNVTEDGYYAMWHDESLSKIDPLIDINGYEMYTDGTNYFWYDRNNSTLYTWDGSNYVTSQIDVGTLTRCKGRNYALNSTGGLIGLNLNILKRIDFGSYKGARFAGTQILTFEEWVMLCKKLGVEIYVDTKVSYTTQIITALATVVKRCGMSEKVSFIGITSTALIDALRNVIDGARCGLLAYPSSTNIATYEPYNVGRGFFYDCDGRNVTTEQITAITLGLDAGFEVETWCIASTLTETEQFELIRRLVSYGVTGVTLDHYRVDEAFAYLLNQY